MRGPCARRGCGCGGCELRSSSVTLAPGAGRDPRPLVLHLVYRFDTGGLENGVVNLINHMPAGAYRHAVVALTEVVPGVAARIRRDDVAFFSLRSEGMCR